MDGRAQEGKLAFISLDSDQIEHLLVRVFFIQTTTALLRSNNCLALGPSMI
jgi:hypothetical protein